MTAQDKLRTRAAVSRRRLLLAAGGVTAASLLACGGSLAMLASPVPAMDYGQSNCGMESTMEKVLVAYASRYGSTAEVAQTIADQLCQHGDTVDVRAVQEVQDLSPYRAVVVGGAVRMGNLLAPAVKFLERHKDALNRLPVALFAVHILALDDSEASRQERAAYLDAARKVVTPQHEAFFAGKVDMRRLHLGERLMARVAHSPEGDLRDWAAIRAWADSIHPLLPG